ncbi:efflux RND transporter periplasmic adaptor subunit [Thalassospira sp. GB04J01]|uniref:efflux RND transporter periplasmic adaptor subunit n=1 Tax=Thalassospira sp. GB04J01 TaxID=1485225 RepID=UPI000C9A3857|nr:efflux RND transporter periplasmic adaptor subunit [Thalassospira sp. GB04J01]|tara:strand:- start:46533 stop:47663 length:1131 start_codon:yes stop_codon:yes gene_type:complete
MGKHYVRFLTLLFFTIGNFSVQAQENAAPVAVEEVREAEIMELVPLNGTVSSVRASLLSSEIAGKVQAIHVDGGAQVKEGDTLLKLDDRLAKLSLQQSEAAAREAEAALTDAERRLKMGRELVERQTISQDEWRRRETEVASMRAIVDGAHVARKEQELRVELHDVKAPFSGVVARRISEEGAWVDPGDPVVELVDMDHLRIEVPVPQQYLPRLSDDTGFQVELGGFPDEHFEANLESIIPVGEVASRTFIIHIVLRPEQNVSINPGMSARVIIRFNTGERGLLVSRDAILRHPDGRITVWVLDEKGDVPVVSERRIETGLAFDGKIQIRGGLSVGESVVVEGNESLSPGQAVRLEHRAAEISLVSPAVVQNKVTD